MNQMEDNKDIIESFDIKTNTTEQVTFADPMVLLTMLLLLILFIYVSAVRRQNNL